MRENGRNGTVRIHYLGHSSFVLDFGGEVSVLTDYGAPNAFAEYGWDDPICDIGSLVPDVMTISHTRHADHYDEERIPEGVSHILKEGEGLDLRGVRIEGIPTSEDTPGGSDNASYVFRYREMTLVHLGDCQADIMACESPVVRERLIGIFPEHIDILLMPIEGREKFIPQAEVFVSLLTPSFMVPMHFWSEDYRSGFLSYLQSRGYMIRKRDTPDHVFTAGGPKPESTVVISLTASPRGSGNAGA